MATVPADVQGPSDAELIDSVRGGTIDAYGQLYERHVSAAYNLARQLARSSSEADDLVSDAFAKVLDTLRAGRGPDTAFRAYLLTALRHTAYDKTRRDKKVELADDVAVVAPEATSVPFQDTAVAGLERSMAAKAFARLPERWQTVLWHTEIEGQSPAEVAPLLGLTANGVSALAYRAREGLKQAYLQVHLAETQAERCHATVDRLGAWTRGGLSKREATQVEAHLDGCTSGCRALAAELADVNGALRGIIAPLVLGVGATGYLAAAASGTAKAATVVAAAAGTGGAAGAAASAPRQLFTAAASTAALAIAIAIGLATSGSQNVPAAQTASPPTSTQAPTVQAPPQVIQPPPAPQQPQPSQPPPAAPAPVTEPVPPAPEPVPPPAPAPAELETIVPSGFALTPGGEPAALPITVRNTGGTVSPPVTAELELPPGVRSVGDGASFAGTRPARFDGSAEQSVTCPAGRGAITCTTRQGIAPGGSATFVLHLQADPDAVTGRIVGTIGAGTSLSVPVELSVEIRPIDDELELAVHKAQHGFWDPRLDIRVTNKGVRPGTMRLVVESDKHITLVALRSRCERSPHQVVCEAPLERDASFQVSVWTFGAVHREGVVRVTATLGNATKTVDVPISLRPDVDEWDGPHPTIGAPTAPIPTGPAPVDAVPVSPPHAPQPTTTEPGAPEPTEPAGPGTTEPGVIEPPLPEPVPIIEPTTEPVPAPPSNQGKGPCRPKSLVTLSPLHYLLGDQCRTPS